MAKPYLADTFTEDDVLLMLRQRGLTYKLTSRYILCQCPMHTDKNPSAQIYRQDWWVQCHAGCGRFHITKPFPNLRPSTFQATFHAPNGPKGINTTLQKNGSFKPPYSPAELMSLWQSLKPIIPPTPEKSTFKDIPLDHLHDLGWRQADERLGLGSGWFIPYFSRTKTSIPFGQVRHFSGERRFSFLPSLTATCYGTWNLVSGDTVFVVEGTSDAVTLDYCAIPWIAIPSASNTSLLKDMASWCLLNGVDLVYAGDNDEAGNQLRDALDSITPYRVCQPPPSYKDYSDFFQAEGLDAVYEWCSRELFA